MGALRIDVCENIDRAERDEIMSPPRLVLTSFEELLPEAKSASAAKNNARVRRGRRQRRDGYWLSASMICLVVAGVGGLWGSLANTHHTLRPETITVTVKPGDTLWKFAERYGSSDRYILERVDELAHANALPRSAALVPGQRLKIAVSNSVELAKLETSRETKLARL